MKIGFFYDYSDSGTERVVVPIAKAMRAAGHEIAVQVVDKGRALPPGFDRSLADLDYAHFWNLQTAGLLAPGSAIPWGLTVHHVQLGTEPAVVGWIASHSPDLIHTIDPFTHVLLGRYELPSLLTPQPLERGDWTPLPYPTQFTLGWLGAAGASKRTHVVEEIARRLGVPCVGWDGDGVAQPWLGHEGARDLYRRMSVFVCASFEDGGPLPAQEALLCGRPVVSTRVGQMPAVIAPGATGEFFDGSVEDGCWAVERVKTEFDAYALRAREWEPLPDRAPAAVASEMLARIEALV